MFNKKISIVLISVFILIFSLTCVSATQDNITTDELAVDENINIGSSIKEEYILEDLDSGSFTDLIQNTTENNEIKLEKDYNNACIDKSITINGQGHSIGGVSIVWQNLTGHSNITLKNINFKKSGVILPYDGLSSKHMMNGLTINIINCNFTNSSRIILDNGDIGIPNFNTYVINSTFNNSLGIRTDNAKTFVFNTKFINNTNFNIKGDIISVYNSIFINNSCKDCLINSRERICSIYNCTFINNSIHDSYGSLIHLYLGSKITNSTFINNKPADDWDSMTIRGVDLYIINSTLINNTRTLPEETNSENTILNSIIIEDGIDVTKKYLRNSSIDKDDKRRNEDINTKKTTKIITKKTTFKAKKKTKKYIITLKAGKKAVKKVKVTLKIGKKIFKATTNNNGKAVFKIKLNKKGTYNSKITFKGNKNYKATSKTVKIKIK